MGSSLKRHEEGQRRRRKVWCNTKGPSNHSIIQETDAATAYR